MKYFRKQRGVAIIVIALSMVAIGGMAQLAIEGGRMIQETNRLADASEAATLAVAIANNTEEGYADKVARDYLEQYLPNVAINDVKVIRGEGKEVIDGNTLYYVQYEVEANATFDAQINFLDNDGANITETRSVDNDAMARTYMLPSDLDLVFVADFSGSMNDPWGDKTQLQHLKDQVDIISKDLLSSSATNAGYAHRIGFVPFNLRTREKLAGENEYRCVTELEYKTNISGTKINYTGIDWHYWGKKNANDVSNCISKEGVCEKNTNLQKQASFIDDVFKKSKSEVINNSYYRYPDPKFYVDIDKTAINWLESKTKVSNLHPEASNTGTNLFHTGMCGDAAKFESIHLSLEAPAVEEMKASGWTSVYQGLIRGAQILAEGRTTLDDPDKSDKYHERAQMLLILSDGQENPYQSTFTDLVNAGLCSNIREHFIEHDSPLYIGVIGINFDASEESEFHKCADGIIDVSHSQDLLDKIQELIQKGAATNGVSRLYDKTL
ncbi:hypothetical protein A9264_06065 [Vibrio sp. UCD-FRSSP16_10]|uniref:TadE/TadG family type IV pilus assembly protein n=1 Tax=unclassified Vibrio TaxID=2614977 RepID=UPI000800ED00|nr:MULTISPECIES: TadE/TadG family type IV pilus assembly protein [unclassified Vibrio]OBT15852.1 hypothetical protein A9264_06065 [Vibrio sp. UCD-FRSSP16_10]OBT17746.1 hypothetical protein A9260_00060 [Vibrio sp. UCD-FRSSP16_30]